AVLAWSWNRVELPQLLPGPDVKGANQTLGVVVSRNGSSLSEGRTNDDDITGDGRRRVNANLARFEIDLLFGAVHRTDLQVDEAAVAERADDAPGLRVQLDESVPSRDVDDALIARPVGPIGKPSTR